MSVCLSALSNGLPLNKFVLNLILETSVKICREDPNLVKNGHKYQVLHTNAWVRLCCWRQYEILARQQCKWTNGCFSMATLNSFILLRATYVAQQHKGKLLLHFYGNNGYANLPQGYVIFFFASWIRHWCLFRTYTSALKFIPSATWATYTSSSSWIVLSLFVQLIFRYSFYLRVVANLFFLFYLIIHCIYSQFFFYVFIPDVILRPKFVC